VSRGFLLSFIALGLVLAALFAAFPDWDVRVAAWFFDPESGKFPLSADNGWKTVRQAVNYVPFILVAPAVFALLYKFAFPRERMLMAPSVILWGPAAPAQRAAIRGLGQLPALVAAPWRVQAELLLRLGRGEPCFLGGRAGFADAASGPPPSRSARQLCLAPRWAACAWRSAGILSATW
jgi:hypothetical protein